MSVDKMVKKTIEVLDKQRELNQLIIEMKEEVKKIEQQNLALNSENQKLRERIEKSQLLPRLKEDPVTIEKVPKKPEIQVAHETPKVEIPIEVKKPVDPIKPVQTKPQSDARNGLVEFFLGKNVIAKIAAILMVLAVLTFGQRAYIDWLNNVGRYVLILSIGFIFLGLGYLFEFKKIDVYSHIFYITEASS